MRDRLRREHPDARAEVARGGRAGIRPPDVAAVLRMQALAGNAATSRLLARDAKAPAQERTIDMEGIGVFPLLAFQIAGEKGVSITLADGPVAPLLFRASSSGTPIPTVTIAASGHTIVLTNVLVAGFQYSGHGGEAQTVAVQLDAASREFR